MRNLIRELHKEIRDEASKEDIDVEKLLDLLYSYQILKPYQSPDEVTIIRTPKLSKLDFDIIGYIGISGRSSLKKVYTGLGSPKSTIKYRIDRLVDKGILMKIPTVVKDKPIELTYEGKEIFSKKIEKSKK